MAGIKDKLSRIKKGAAEAAPSPEPVQESTEPLTLFPEKAASPDAPATSGGGQRFGGLKNVRVGDFSEALDGGADDGAFLDGDIPFESLSKTRPAVPPAPSEPARTAGRFGSLSQQQPRPQVERQVANPPIQARAPVARRPPVELPIIQWDDPLRPAGSSYSEEEWLAAEEGGAMVVFEMVKPEEIGLCAIPRASMNGVEALLYSRSLVVSEDVETVSQWPIHAKVVHRDPVLGADEVIRYRVVRSAHEIKKTPWLQGSVLRNDLEVAFYESKAEQAERSRFGNMPRQR